MIKYFTFITQEIFSNLGLNDMIKSLEPKKGYTIEFSDK